VPYSGSQPMNRSMGDSLSGWVGACDQGLVLTGQQMRVMSGLTGLKTAQLLSWERIVAPDRPSGPRMQVHMLTGQQLRAISGLTELQTPQLLSWEQIPAHDRSPTQAHAGPSAHRTTDETDVWVNIPQNPTAVVL